ncbi:hypothetical protein KC19_7G027000 [Ceratodon purpureus]|uniref:Uncharacterized protein n=1 Tax=Ceratodon purpureus TaxID=3225 RepID=A0A8T0H6N7_CERPU|nr:hypothetical protein KC19_7G027000 [Ceratodon purpureus]
MNDERSSYPQLPLPQPPVARGSSWPYPGCSSLQASATQFTSSPRLYLRPIFVPVLSPCRTPLRTPIINISPLSCDSGTKRIQGRPISPALVSTWRPLPLVSISVSDLFLGPQRPCMCTFTIRSDAPLPVLCVRMSHSLLQFCTIPLTSDLFENRFNAMAGERSRSATSRFWVTEFSPWLYREAVFKGFPNITLALNLTDQLSHPLDQLEMCMANFDTNVVNQMIYSICIIANQIITYTSNERLLQCNSLSQTHRLSKR